MIYLDNSLENIGYFYTINNEDDKRQLCDIGRLYTRITRKWYRNSYVLFLTTKGCINLLGYGIVDLVKNYDEFEETEKNYMISNNYKQCLVFKILFWYRKKMSIMPFLKKPVRHITLHGKEINDDLLDDIFEFAEEKQAFIQYEL